MWLFTDFHIRTRARKSVGTTRVPFFKIKTMKREILFKALKADGKGWVEGDLVRYRNTPLDIDITSIIKSDGLKHAVLPDTVCQYTGLDEQWINGKQVFESDKLYNKDREETCVVVWVETKGAWFVEYADGEQHYLFMSLGNLNEVTGNIHDK